MLRCLTLALVLLAPAPWPPAARVQAQAPQTATVSIVDSGPTSLTLELQVPDLAAQESAGPDGPCYDLSAPGLIALARQGQPLVPSRGVLLAVPGLALRLDILEATSRTLDAYPLCPTPRPAPAWTGNNPDGLYPGPLAEIRASGLLRGQAVAQVQFYPVQVDPARRQVLFYSHVRVRLAFDSAAITPRPARTSGGPFDSLLHTLLLNEPSPVAAAPAPGPARTLGSQAPALKVLVDEDGLTRITPADLAAAGWDPAALDPRTLKLSHQGAELPVWVAGQDDGSFDDGDFLLFYGQAMTGPYTRRNVYWLTAGGAAGLRMAERDAAPVHGYPVPASFPATLHAEEHPTWEGYWQNPPGGEAQDHWYWTGPLAAPASADLSFQMPPFDSTAISATLRVQLAGRTDDWSVNPDHHTRLRLNGALLDDAWWDGQIEFQHSAVFSPALLSPGANTLTVETVGDSGAAVDSLYANWLEVDYPALYASQNDELAFGVPAAGDYQFRVSGFSSDDVAAFDLGDPLAPVRLLHVASQPDSSGYTAVLEDSSLAAARYLALTPASYRSPAGLVADHPSDLENPANGADEILLTYDDFYTDTLPLAAHRQAQGLRVQVVRVGDVYDEFSGGVFTPQAIHDFLAYAYEHWAPPAPTYVLLVGDAHLDYLDRFGTGMPNYVPSYIFDADQVGETANDTWFACVDGADPLPDLFLGRISARSRADVQTLVAKIIAYETNAPSGAWASRALFVADDDLSLFETASEDWISRLPLSYQRQRVYAGAYPPGNPQSDIVSAINDGAFLVSYVGHGNQDRWGTWSGGRLLDSTTVDLLANAPRLPFVVTATCLNGFFVNPLLADCLAEEWVRKADGGAIGVWSPTALGSPLEHKVLFGELFEGLFGAEQPTLGSTTTQAKLSAYSQGVSEELIETFTLFGDPALRLEVTAGHEVYLPLVVKGVPGS